MLPHAAAGADRAFRITGRHVLIAMLAFFGIVIAVNVAFVYMALGTWTGLTDHDSYRSGISWNRTLERDAAQRALGWSTGIETRTEPLDGGARRLEVVLTLRDRGGRPVRGLAFAGQLRHPVLEAADRGIDLVETEAGIYRGSVELSRAADWELTLTATRPDGSMFRIDTVAVVR